jgi:hypothetical protein
MNKKTTFHALLTLCIVSFVTAACLIVCSIRHELMLITAAKKLAQQEIRDSIRKMEAPLKILEQAAHSLADEAGAGQSDGTALQDHLIKVVKKNHDILEVSVAYVPFTADSGPGLYGPSAELKEGKALSFDLGHYLDYTQEEWYREALAYGRPDWSGPYLDRRTKTCVVSYTIPFSPPGHEKTIAGVVHVAVSLDAIRNHANSIELGHSLVRCILSRKGTYIHHPLKEVVENQVNLFETMKDTRDSTHEGEIRKALEGEHLFIESRSPADECMLWNYFDPLPSTGWLLVSIYTKDQFTVTETAHRRQHIIIVLASIVFLTALAALLSGAWALRKRGLWATSLVFTFLCMGGACYIWYIVFTAPLNPDGDDIFLTDGMTLHKALSDYEASAKKAHGKPLVYVPTGIYLETLEFDGSNNLKAMGYIWQKYARGLDSTIAREFTFPEASSLSMKEVSRTDNEGIEVIRWKFEATIREQFDYSKYPFDRPDIWLWIKHGDLDNRVVLTPDFSAYKVLSPQYGPGLPEKGLVLPGYTLMGTYFDYQKTIATTDFGVKGRSGSETFPELYYHVLARRNILNPFVSKVFPLLIMLSMLFVVKLKFSNSKEEKEIFGISGIGILGTVISFFFSTMLSQSNLRSEVNVERITFMENFHLITYFMLFLMAVTTFFFIGSKKPSILEYEDCLVSKILYWPIVTGLVLAATIVYYY